MRVFRFRKGIERRYEQNVCGLDFFSRECIGGARDVVIVAWGVVEGVGENTEGKEGGEE